MFPSLNSRLIQSSHFTFILRIKDYITINIDNVITTICKFAIKTFSFTGRVWSIVFPEQDTYIYRNEDKERVVVTILRRVQEGRRYLGIDFWYSHYYIVGRYGIPDFYKVTVSFLPL